MSLSLLLLQLIFFQPTTQQSLNTSIVALETVATNNPKLDTLQATIKPEKDSDAIVVSNMVSICKGEGYFTGGRPRFVSGIFRDTLSTRYGRDSIIVTNLSIIDCSFAE